MIHAIANTESIVAPTLFRPEFLHSLDPKQKLVEQSLKGFVVDASVIEADASRFNPEPPAKYLHQHPNTLRYPLCS